MKALIISTMLLIPGASFAQQYYPNPPQQYYRRCNPTAGALLGAGLASAITGNKYSYGGNYSNNRNYGYNGNSGYSNSSGNWNNSGSNSSGWTMFGAGLGALLFGC